MMRHKVVLFFAAFTLLISNSFAQNTNDSIVSLNLNNNWEFRVSPYFWYLGLKGEIIKPPQPSNIPEFEPSPSLDFDLKFKDINSSIKFFMMLSSKYRIKNFVVSAGITSIILDGKAVTPFELISKGVNYKFNYLTSEISAGYRIIKKQKINLDGSLGVRILYTKIEGSTNILGSSFEGNRSVYWYDPIVGLHFKYFPINRLELSLYSDFGPLKEISSYQILAQGSYFFSKLFNMSLGYRNYFINSENDKKNTIYKGRVYGPYLRFGFQF